MHESVQLKSDRELPDHIPNIEKEVERQKS